jgi:uncharacterized membrane protein
MEKTSTGLQENIASLLCYLFGWVTGIIFLLLEPKNKMIRFHAFQSIIIFGALNILWFVFFFIPFLWVLYWIIEVLAFILWIVLMVRAYQGQKWKVPVAGDMAETWANK